MTDEIDGSMASENAWLARPDVSGAAYDAPYRARAEAGEDVHGEANAVLALHPSRPLHVLDAGCGTGRIAIELAHHGVDIVGVDIDARMLDRAREKAPELDWRLDDLATCALGCSFDLILLAGNVMLFVTPGTEAQVVRNMARHLVPHGLLVAGFQRGRTVYDLAAYDAAATTAGLILHERWATWQGAPWTPTDPYAVSIHRFALPVPAANA